MIINRRGFSWSWPAALILAAAVFAAPARAGEDAWGRAPVFVGRTPATACPELTAGAAYMTAAEMQAKVASLTGFSHPAFDDYADVLGRFDPKTGQRTNAQPSLMGVLVLQQIATSVASYVLEREAFLDPSERIVFANVAFTQTPTDPALAETLRDLHRRWLGSPPGEQTLKALQGQFRRAEAAQGTPAGYAAAVSLLLQHGGLYYY